jgi:hypothetical protein
VPDVVVRADSIAPVAGRGASDVKNRVPVNQDPVVRRAAQALLAATSTADMLAKVPKKSEK